MSHPSYREAEPCKWCSLFKDEETDPDWRPMQGLDGLEEEPFVGCTGGCAVPEGGECLTARVWMWVNVYLTSQAYGGSEEGGWYYSAGEPVASIAVRSVSSLREALAKMQAWVEEENEQLPPAHSVLSRGGYEVRIEKHFAREYPDSRPAYE